MTHIPPIHQPPPVSVPNSTLALAVYVLYFIAYFTGITALVGVIIAYVQVADADPMVRTHYQFQIRTFWLSVVYVAVGTVLSLVLIGFLLLAWWFVWSLIRSIKGVLLLNDGKPVANPTSWMFG